MWIRSDSGRLSSISWLTPVVAFLDASRRGRTLLTLVRLSLLGLSPLGLFLLAVPSTANAQCEDEFAIVSSAPNSAAPDVPRNAYIRIDYPNCFFSQTGQDPATSIELSLDGELVPGRIELADDQTLFFIPDEPLLPNREYRVVAVDFEGGQDFTFRTTARFDEEPPVFGEVQAVNSSSVETEDGELAYRVDVTFDPATDDGAAGSIEYLLYLTRGPEDLEAPELVARTRNFMGAEITMAFILAETRATEPVCIVVHAVDGLGRADTNQRPTCFEPIMGSFFDGCSVMAHRRGPGGLALAGVALAFAWRRLRRR